MNIDTQRIERLRRVEGLNWKEVAERVGMPYQKVYRAVKGRKESKAALQRRAALKKLREENRMLRARLRHVEDQLKLKGLSE